MLCLFNENILNRKHAADQEYESISLWIKNKLKSSKYSNAERGTTTFSSTKSHARCLIIGKPKITRQTHGFATIHILKQYLIKI